MPDTIAHRICKRFDELVGDRKTWESHWQDIADLVVPNREFTDSSHPGDSKRQKIFDATAPFAANRLAGSLVGLLTNPSLMWFSLRVEDDALNEQDDVREWLQIATTRMLHVFNTPRFGFYSSLHEVLLDVIAFGTAVLFNKNTPNSLNYEALPLSNCYIDEDQDGNVDTLYRKFEFTPSQAAAKFGKSNLSEKTQKALEGDKICKVTFLQAVLPRRDRNPLKKTSVHKPWASYVIELAEKHLVKESGFDDFPFAVPRWSKMAGEMYGRGPSMGVLPDIRLTNAMSRSLLVATEKIADPPIMLPDDGFLAPFKTRPGGLNYYRSGTKDRAEPLITQGRPDIGLDALERRREVIRAAHFLDMFELPLLDRMTATEVQQRQRDKQQVLNPVLSRLYVELLTPIIDRAFTSLAASGVFPEPPQSIAGRDTIVEYQSPLALSQRASESAGFAQMLALIEPMASVDPTVMLNFHPDEVIHWSKGMFNVPQRIFRDRDEVEKMRQEIQQQQAAQAQAATARDGMAALKDASSAAEQLETIDALAG